MVHHQHATHSIDVASNDDSPAIVTAVSVNDNKPSSDTASKKNTTVEIIPVTSDLHASINVDQLSQAEQQRKTSDKGRGRAIDFTPTVMSAVDKGVDPIIFVTSPPAVALASSAVKAKSMKDLSDVSMDEIEETDSGVTKEQSNNASKISDKDCESVSRPYFSQRIHREIYIQNYFTYFSNCLCFVQCILSAGF